MLAGDGPVQGYSQWVNEAQLGEQVIFAGWVKGKQKQELLQNARILLLPSRREGMPMSILEAMAYGEAVVSTRVGGIPEAMEEGGSGFLIEPDDEHSLYRTIRRLLWTAGCRSGWDGVGARLSKRNLIWSRFTASCTRCTAE